MLTTTSDPHGETEAIRSRRERGEAKAFDQASGIGRKFEGSLRVAVGAVDRQVSDLAARATTVETASIGALLSAWAELCDQLALGPAPDVRSCPECGRLGMSAATLCGYCWVPLLPLRPRASGTD